MKRTFLDKAIMFLVAAFSLVIIPSCVDADYELSEERLNTEVTVFQSGLSLPIGKTSPLTLASLLEQLDEETRQMLSNNEGAYVFRMADTLDFGETLAGVTDAIKIESFDLGKREFVFKMSGVDLSGLTIDVPDVKPQTVDVAGMLKIPELKLPEVAQSLHVEQGVPEIPASNLKFDMSEALDMRHEAEFAAFKDDDNFLASDELLKLPMATTEMSYKDLAGALDKIPGAPKLPDIEIAESFDPYPITVPIRIVLPEQIKSVKDIQLNKNATVELDVILKNSFFTSGEVNPQFDVDLHDLFHLTHSDTGVSMDDHINDHFILSSENGWESYHEYHVESLAITGQDFERQADGKLVLDKKITVTASGNVHVNDLKTTIKHLHDHNAEPMNVIIELKFNDFDIDNVKMELNPISLEKELEMPIKVDGIKLPEIVEKVEYVTLDKNNPLNLDMQAVIPAAYSGLDVKLDKLEIIFPEGFDVKNSHFDPSTRTILYNDVSLTKGMHEQILVDRLNFPAPVGGVISYDGNVKVKAVATAEGEVNSKDLIKPDEEIKKSGAGDKMSVDVSIDYKPVLSDYSAVINDYVYDADIDPVSFSEKLPAEIGKMDKVSVQLETEGGQQPEILITLDYPEHEAIRILPKAGEGLKVLFPKPIVFDLLPESYNYNPEDNSINFKEDTSLPKEIRLPISRLDIVPEPVEGKEGEYCVSGKMEVLGGVRLAGTTISKSVIDDLVASDAKILLSASIPTLKPKELELGEYMVPIEESFEFGGIDLAGLPDMLKSIDNVLLKDVELNLEIDASSITSVVSDADVALDLSVKLPEIIVVEGAKDNILSINAALDKDSKIVIDPVKVTALDLSGVELGKEGASLGDLKIDINGNVTLKNADVDLDKLGKEDLKVTVDGGISSKDSDEILIDKVEAVVDYQIDPVNMSLDLSGLTGSLGEGIDFRFDLNRFNIALEVKTNLGIPVQADLSVIPYSDGQAKPAIKPDKPLTLNYSQSAKDTVYTKYWISNTDMGKPEDYQWVDLDLLSILKDMPDSLQLSLEAGTPENAKITFEPNEDYVLEADYAFELPLELGEEFMLEFADTLQGLPQQLGTILSAGSLGLAGNITNSLPVQLELTFNLLDENGEPVEMTEGAGAQTIKAGNLDGSPSVTELNVVLGIKKEVQVSNISAVELKFKATSGGHAGTFRDDNFIQAELRALLPEGITVDLKDFMGKENEEDEQ